MPRSLLFPATRSMRLLCDYLANLLVYQVGLANVLLVGLVLRSLSLDGLVSSLLVQILPLCLLLFQSSDFHHLFSRTVDFGVNLC